MVTPPADITTLPSLLPGIGGGTLAFLIVLGAIWRGGLKEFLEKRALAKKEANKEAQEAEARKQEAETRKQATELAIAVSNANMTGSLERGLQAAERTADKYDKMLVRQEEIARRHEALLESQET